MIHDAVVSILPPLDEVSLLFVPHLIPSVCVLRFGPICCFLLCFCFLSGLYVALFPHPPYSPFFLVLFFSLCTARTGSKLL